MNSFFKGILTGLFISAAILACMISSSCATRTVSISPDGTMNATSTVLLYCPAAEATKLTDGNRAAETLSDSSGVGSVIKELLEP